MGVYTYWAIVATVIILGLILPQEGKRKGEYIVLMTLLHIFICGWKYIYITGDLRKYAFFYETESRQADFGWFSEGVFHGGRNAGFYWLCKAISLMTNGDFHIFLVFLAVVTQVIVGVLIYKYSPKPWFSFLIWNCMQFYITYEFSAIKQGLAMSLLMLAYIGIVKRKPLIFLVVTLLAGFIHGPALCFLPAYYLATRRIDQYSLIAYIFMAVGTFVFRNQVMEFFSDIYYEDDMYKEVYDVWFGGRFVVIVLIVFTGLALKGLYDRRFEGLFNLMIISAIFQLFSVYDNVFTRLADYYFQFTILYIPMIFYERKVASSEKNMKSYKPFINLDQGSKKMLVVILTGILIWWYYVTCLGHTIENTVDDVLNYRFNWEV